MYIEFFENYLGADNPLVLVAVVGTALAVAIVFCIVLSIFFRKLKRRADKTLFAEILSEMEYPLYCFIAIVAISASLQFVPSEASLTGVIRHALSILVIITVAWVIINVVDVARIFVVSKYDVDVKDNLEARKIHTQFKVLEQIIITIVVVIAFSAALMTFDKVRQLGVSLLASAGVIGIIIGFAAQRSIATIVAGFQIAITQPIRIDDVVIVEGEWGRIEEITLTYVVMKIWDERRLIVPISYFIEKPFQNWTRVSADLLGTVFIYADYNVPVDKIREELTRLLKSNEHWDGRVNNVQVTNVTEKTTEIRALMSAANSGALWDLRVFVREKLVAFLQQQHPESRPRVRMELKQKT